MDERDDMVDGKFIIVCYQFALAVLFAFCAVAAFHFHVTVSSLISVCCSSIGMISSFQIFDLLTF